MKSLAVSLKSFIPEDIESRNRIKRLFEITLSETVLI
jgi:hypothetical protein